MPREGAGKGWWIKGWMEDNFLDNKQRQQPRKLDLFNSYTIYEN
jgi:hypothetical protein